MGIREVNNIIYGIKIAYVIDKDNIYNYIVICKVDTSNWETKDFKTKLDELLNNNDIPFDDLNIRYSVKRFCVATCDQYKMNETFYCWLPITLDGLYKLCQE